MKIVGYADRLSVRQGEPIQFMVSCELDHYDAQIVRLIHGDRGSAGPGFKEEPIETSVTGRYRGREQKIYAGSYAVVPLKRALASDCGLTFQAWILPTTPNKGRQGLLTRWSRLGNVGLFIAEEGQLEISLGSRGTGERLLSGAPMRKSTWYFVAAVIDPESGMARLYQDPVERWPFDDSCSRVERKVSAVDLGASEESLIMAACSVDGATRPSSIDRHFNGKIDRPRLFDEALDEQQIERLRSGVDPFKIGSTLIGAWDLGKEPASSRIYDLTTNALHGTLINVPTRAVVGYNWTGLETNFKSAPGEYGAIHFHDDDLDDAGWDVDFTLNVPAGLRSGVYAAKLTCNVDFDYVPFFVRPVEGARQAVVLFLVPTLSYMAYGNEHLPSRPGRAEAAFKMSLAELISLGSPYERAAFQYILTNRLHSLYDFHTDGSGVAYTTRLRPIVNFRPLYNKPALRFRGSHQFNEDLYLVDWLIEKGFEFDVATDEDLHFEGKALLDAYRVVLTGSHPEYWTETMLTTLQGYLQGGGRLMYLGGNGFYWVTSFDPERPHIVEVRRHEAGVRTWQANQGEYHHSTTGELGGLWRYRGKVPQRIVGIGMTATGGEPARPYRRQPDSHNPRAAFIFEGIAEEEIIGDFGLHLGGAAGWELDRADERLGTPPHTLVIASSFGHSDVYQLTVEELWKTDPNVGGTQSSDVRADMVYFEYPNGGAVFSVGSISYCGSLSHNKYENNISRITENVLRAFSRERLPGPSSNWIAGEKE